MIVHADDPISSQLEVLNLDTYEFIRNCEWANQETGEYCVYNLDIISNGFDYSKNYLKGNIIIVYKGE